MIIIFYTQVIIIFTFKGKNKKNVHQRCLYSLFLNKYEVLKFKNIHVLKK